MKEIENFTKKSDESEANYYIKIIEVDKHKLALVIDCNLVGRSVTNAIEEIAKINEVENIIYRDSLGTFDFWSVEHNFKTLAINGVEEKNLDNAILTTQERYLNKSLFD